MILSARFANPDHTAAIIETDDRGAVAISQADTPDAWAELLAWGEPEAFVEIDPVPETISKRQFYQALAMRGIITTTEALYVISSGLLPQALQTFLSALPDNQEFGARMLLIGATEFKRSHPLTAAVGEAQNMTPEEIDEFWRFAATL